MTRKYFGFRGDLILTGDPRRFDWYTEDRGLWHETPGEQARAAARAARNRRLLAWVRAEMEVCLTDLERRSVTLHYFEGRSLAETGRRVFRERTTVCRILQRAIGKLRKSARRDGLLDWCPGSDI